nr:hypothetical protein HmN_000355600 [Hymenolepis microstoma]
MHHLRQLFYESEEREEFVDEIVSQLLDNTEIIILSKWAIEHTISYTFEKCISDISSSIILNLPSYLNERKKCEKRPQFNAVGEPEIDSGVLESTSHEIVEEVIEYATNTYEFGTSRLSPDSEYDNSDSSSHSLFSLKHLFIETTEFAPNIGRASKEENIAWEYLKKFEKCTQTKPKGELWRTEKCALGKSA